MAVDTREKRASCTRLFTPLPLPAGSVAVGDRYQVSWIYYVAPSADPNPITVTFSEQATVSFREQATVTYRER